MTQRKKTIYVDDLGYGWEDLYFACYEAAAKIPKEGVVDMRCTMWALSAVLYTYLRYYEEFGSRGYYTLDSIRVISDWSDVDPKRYGRKWNKCWMQSRVFRTNMIEQ